MTIQAKSSKSPKSPKPSTLAADRTETRRSEILDAAYQVFADKGYRDTTVADIAKVLGIGHGTFYRYFENKHDVFENVLTTALLRVSRAISAEDPTASNSAAEYRAQVERIGSGMLDLLNYDPAIQRLLFYEAMGISPELDEKIQRVWEMAGSVTEAYLLNGKAKGFLAPELDTEAVALAINALIFEGGRRVVRAADRDAARKRWLKALVSLIFQGISR